MEQRKKTLVETLKHSGGQCFNQWTKGVLLTESIRLIRLNVCLRNDPTVRCTIWTSRYNESHTQTKKYFQRYLHAMNMRMV